MSTKPVVPVPMTTSTGDKTLATVGTEQKHPSLVEEEVKYMTSYGALLLSEVKDKLAKGFITLGHLGDDALAALKKEGLIPSSGTATPMVPTGGIKTSWPPAKK